MSRKFSFTGLSGEDLQPEFTRFANIIGLERSAPDRYSVLLLLQLYDATISGRMNPAKVVHEIASLEGIRERSHLKAPVQNRHPPLKGLWHKHYTGEGIREVAINVRRALGKHGSPVIEERIKASKKAGVIKDIQPDDIAAIANDIVHGGVRRLIAKQEVTGHWLIFAKHNGLNYYLCLTTHDTSEHQGIRDQIDHICCREFAFLPELLASA